TRALKATKNAGLQPAMDWLFAHADDPDDVATADTPAEGSDTAAAAAGNDDEIRPEDATAASLKCDDCGRLLRNPTAAEAHAIKTGHQNFSESTEAIKPLTEEEKQAKLADLRARLVAKREDQRAQDAAEQKEREKIRRKAGQDITALKERQKEVEMKKQLEEKRREKEAERVAREKIKAQIEQDKKDRAARIEKERLERLGIALAPPAGGSSPPAPAPAAAAAAGPKTYTEARIQSRLILSTAVPT
ncbi:hypothetical protein HK405_005283, partial [Cladochytrium tenue]